MQNKYYLPDEHIFYDDLATMLMAISSYMFTLHVAITSNNPKEFKDRSLSEWINYIRPIKDPTFPLEFYRNYDKKSIVFYPFEIISQISLNGWPQYIEHSFKDISENPNEKKYCINSEINTKTVSKLIGSSFLNFYETYKKEFISIFGKEIKNWPNLLKFAKLIRNGFAHNGKFDIRNKKMVPVNWGIWNIDSDWNNYEVLFSEKGLAIGDVILVMEEIALLLKSNIQNASHL